MATPGARGVLHLPDQRAGQRRHGTVQNVQGLVPFRVRGVHHRPRLCVCFLSPNQPMSLSGGRRGPAYKCDECKSFEASANPVPLAEAPTNVETPRVYQSITEDRAPQERQLHDQQFQDQRRLQGEGRKRPAVADVMYESSYPDEEDERVMSVEEQRAEEERRHAEKQRRLERQRKEKERRIAKKRKQEEEREQLQKAPMVELRVRQRVSDAWLLFVSGSMCVKEE